ncbi:TetR/AcrR family transcriptional regulator [Rathayibacter soli]|uniref:TetR/AcrR family transcriptional regulator n=1 Tax=Rathayibacter soli TaxID=3144168 RepID=UPI0027E5A51E|nr:TetR/AcrR family transcriptional regulator [Glaciibacter superstes]
MSEAPTIPTEARVKDAAVRLFGKNGFAATGIRDISEASGISVATLYHYMDTKEDLLLDLMLEGMNSLLDSANRVPSDKSASERLSALVTVHIEYHCNRALLARVTDTELRSLNESSRNTIIALRDDYERLWRKTIEQGNTSGEFHVEDVKMVALAALGMCTSVYSWFSPEGPLSVDDIANWYSQLTLRLCGQGSSSR